MSYTLDYIKQNIENRFFGLRDISKVHKIQKELKSLHNQDRIIINFFKSKYYINYNNYDEYFDIYKTIEDYKEKQHLQEKLFTKVTDQYKQYDKSVRKIKIDELKFSHVEPYLKILPHHFDANLVAYTSLYLKDTPSFSRFGNCRLINGIDEKKVKYVLDHTKEINTLLQSPYIFDTQKGVNWHYFLTTSWILFEGGLAEVSLYVANTLENLLNIPMNRFRPAINNVFEALDRSEYIRNWSTVLWLKIMSLLQLDRTTEAIITLKRLINIFINAPYNQTYTLTNRIVEASVLLYQLEPSEETRITSKKLFLLNCSKDLIDPTESTRERGLIIYDFSKYILGEDI